MYIHIHAVLKIVSGKVKFNLDDVAVSQASKSNIYGTKAAFIEQMSRIHVARCFSQRSSLTENALPT